jgi:CBS domain
VLISDVLRTKGGNVVRIRTTDSVELAVRKLAEHRIGALVVEDRWMKPVGIFSERDFINAMARDGAAVLGFEPRYHLHSPEGEKDQHRGGVAARETCTAINWLRQRIEDDDASPFRSRSSSESDLAALLFGSPGGPMAGVAPYLPFAIAVGTGSVGSKHDVPDLAGYAQARKQSFTA